jgi:hypothetical protein
MADKPVYEYEVSLTNTFETVSPEDAVRAMIEWLSSETDPWQLSYRIEHGGAEFQIDASDLDENWDVNEDDEDE